MPTRRPRLLPLLFFLAGILLCIVGVAAIGAGWLVREAPPPDAFAWQSPFDLVKTRELTPATVLLPLTGMSSLDALNASLDGGHWETAFALIAFDSSLDDPTRIGALLQLGSRYAAAKDKNKAGWCYLYAARIATISPLLSDAVRLDTFLQVSADLRSIGALDAARMAVDQAYLVAENSPVLRRESAARRLDVVANAYAALGAEGLAGQVRERASEPLAITTDDAGFLPREPFVVKLGKLPESPKLDSAIKARVAAAKQLVQDVREISPNHATEWPSDSIAQLRDALVDEDDARRAFYDQQTQQVKEPIVRIALLRDKENWQGLKYRIAKGAFGADLVPEWSTRAPELRDEWSEAWGQVLDAYRAQASAIPNAQAVSQATEDVLRQELLALRWGWYRGVSEQELRESLAEVTDQLSQGAIPSLRLDSIALGGKRTELLVPDELYGKNEQALPH